jgi:hypothetical protein
MNPTFAGARVTNLGEVLRSARQKRNLTLSEAAETTRIKSHFLEALEDGNYGVLPGPAYITGFLRNYAILLGLHPDDVVQEYYASRPMPTTSVRPATRVLASGYDRQTRKRLLWALTVVAALILGSFTFKMYSDQAHASGAQLNLTPSNLGGGQPPQSHRQRAPQIVRVQLRATQPSYVRVTVDGVRQFNGLLRPRQGMKTWIGHRAIFVLTYDGSHVRARLNGRPIGLLSSYPGSAVDEATPTGWQVVS